MNFGDSMSMVLDTKKIKFWKSAVHPLSYVVSYDTLLQNVTDNIRKCDSCFITKRVRHFITKCGSYYKKLRFY